MQKPQSTENDDPLLDELKEALQSSFHKSCVEAYLAKPLAVAIAQTALDALVKAINEAEKGISYCVFASGHRAK